MIFRFSFFWIVTRDLIQKTAYGCSLPGSGLPDVPIGRGLTLKHSFTSLTIFFSRRIWHLLSSWIRTSCKLQRPSNRSSGVQHDFLSNGKCDCPIQQCELFHTLQPTGTRRSTNHAKLRSPIGAQRSGGLRVFVSATFATRQRIRKRQNHARCSWLVFMG